MNTLFHKQQPEIWYTKLDTTELQLDYDLLESQRCLNGCGGRKIVGSAVCSKCARFLGTEATEKLYAMQPGDGIAAEVTRMFSRRAM